MRWRSPGPEATAGAARLLADCIGDDGLVLCLIGPLGAGKTAFVKGLAAGLGVDPGRVASPTFVIASEYPAGARHLAHVDLYRVESEAELEAAGFLDLLEPGAVVAIEWADRLPGALPADRLELRIERPADAPRPALRVLHATASGPGSAAVLERWQHALAARGPSEAGGGETPAVSDRPGAVESVATIVQKYGGTSVADIDRIRNVARRVAETVRAGNKVAVVVSAMAGETDRLADWAREVAGEDPDPREYDALLSTGEQRTIALLSMALQKLGQPARSFTGAQMGMRTDTSYTRARIESIDARRIRSVLDEGAVAVIAGFQGVDDDGNITTLGRGGSDTSAVAVAAALGADVCEIYTDVDGVFTTDPRLVEAARKLDRISYDEMIEMASLGAKVLQIRSVRFAMRYGVPLHVRSSFKPEEGTWVVPEEEIMEGLFVSGVTYNRDEAKIRVRGVKDHPGAASAIFTPLSEAGIVVDMIIQNLSQDGSTDVTFTVARGDYRTSKAIIERVAAEIGARGVDGNEDIAKVSIVGLGMKDHAGVASRMFHVLADEGINIQLISTSEIKVSVVIRESDSERAVRALHAAFLEAGAAEPQPEA